MRAMILLRPGPAARLVATDVESPLPAANEVLVRVHVCSVCRTDLDVVDGRLAASQYPVVPGHQVVGEVAAVGAQVFNRRVGDRVGVAWIYWACGVCRWCRSGRENLCPSFRGTGCHANGGYAEEMIVPAAFTFDIPSTLDDAHAAPLLCAGAIGWRSLRLAGIADGESLGLTGFGASAHLVLRIAKHLYPRSPVFVFARNEQEREFAITLGADWAGNTNASPPTPLAAIIDTTPAWTPVVEALTWIEPGGRLVINAIRKSDSDRAELQRIDYATHLWMEREIRSVANVTRDDVRELIATAARVGIRPEVRELPLEAANEALAELRAGAGVRGATVLRVAGGGQ